MKKYLFGLLVLVAFGVFPVFAQSSRSIRQGNFVLKTYMETCAKFIGENSKVSGFAKGNKYIRADENFSKAVLRGKEGEVWGVPNTVGEFFVVLSGGTHCSVWAKQADVKTVNEGFEKIVSGVARPGLTVTPYMDKTSDGVGGQYRQLGYVVKKDGAPHGWFMLSTTSESPSAEVQVRLTMSPGTL